MAQKINIPDCQITFRNLAGRPTEWNKQGGVRSFAAILNPVQAQQLIDMGFDVKQFINKETGEAGDYYLKVKVNFRNDDAGNLIAPFIYTVDEITKKKTLLTPITAGVVDRADIASVDLTITPYYYEVRGTKGISAYCHKMYVNIVADEFEKKYAIYDDNADEIADEIPFE